MTKSTLLLYASGSEQEGSMVGNPDITSFQRVRMAMLIRQETKKASERPGAVSRERFNVQFAANYSNQETPAAAKTARRTCEILTVPFQDFGSMILGTMQL